MIFEAHEVPFLSFFHCTVNTVLILLVCTYFGAQLLYLVQLSEDCDYESYGAQYFDTCVGQW